MNPTENIDALLQCRFDVVPYDHAVRAFGVDYIKCTDTEGGDLYITRHGWPMARHLMPEVWFRNGRFHHEGQRLVGGTGTVYRLGLSQPGNPRVELVVKYSRFAEHVPLFMPSTLPHDLPGYLVENAVFNSPFEEFGLIEDLRRGQYGPVNLRILTKRPLAIYCAPAHLPLWQLGRTPGRFNEYMLALQGDQSWLRNERQLHLEIDRQYIMLFGWVRGENAEDVQASGRISENDMKMLTLRVNRELALKGFRILDNKPKHFILRTDRRGRLLIRNGELVYVQVDFELLQRTDEYLAFLKGTASIR